MPKSWYTTFQQNLRKFGEGQTGDFKNFGTFDME